MNKVDTHVNTSYKTVYKAGFWSALLAFCFTVAYCVVQLLQIAGMLTFPLDEILIYGTSLGIVIPFLLAILSLHYVTPPDKKFWSHGALIFTTLYVMFVTSNYVVQLASVIPNKLRNTAADIYLLEQTPHSLFWNFDALGYIFMGLATIIALPVFKRNGFQRKVAIAFFCNGMVVPLISTVYFSKGYSEKLLLLGLPWAVTAPASMLMLALMFRRLKLSSSSSNTPPKTTRRPSQTL